MSEQAIPTASRATELRVSITARDYAETVRFFRDRLGLTQMADFGGEHGQGVLLAAGVATLEILDERHAAHVDEVEVGRPVAGPVRLAFEVGDVASLTSDLVGAGATLIAPPTTTPWNSLNSRLEGPEGLQLTLFTDLG